MRSFRPFLVFVSFWSAACGTSRPIPDLLFLQQLVADERAAEIEKAEPSQWAEARRYLTLAESAWKRGDRAGAAQLSELGAVHAKIARFALVRLAYRDRLEAAQVRKQAVLEEEERLQAAIEKLEVDAARRSLRAHLEAVVSETRRQAAAEEEQRERTIRGDDRAALRSARRQVGEEMLARTRVWKDLLDVYLAEGLLPPGGAALVDRELAAAEERLGLVDMAGLQQHLENAAVEAGRLRDRVWQGLDGERAAMEREIAARCEALGLEVRIEPFGPSVALSPFSPKDALPALERLGGLLEEMENVRPVVLAAAGFFGQGGDGRGQSEQLARRVSGYLVEAGVPEDRQSARGCGAASPLETLRQGRERVAVLLVPIRVPR